MKKKYIIYVFLLLNLNLFAQGNLTNGEVHYEVITVIDENKLKKAEEKVNGDKELKKTVLSAFKNMGKSKFKLSFNSKSSIFKEDQSLDLGENKINIVRALVGKGVFYTNKDNKTILYQTESFGETFLINMPELKWVLTQETKKIGAHLCYKATTEKKGKNKNREFVNTISAWYAPQIPASYGPKDYFGLPGLILELEEGPLFYKATKIDLSVKEIKIKQPSKGKRISYDEYNKLISKLSKNSRG